MTENETMTLDDAIIHAKEVANTRTDLCEECRVEHKQLAEWLEELKEYRAIGTVEEFRALKEKSVAKNPIEGTDNEGYVEYYCPNCEAHLFFDEEQKFCNECGQALET